MHLFKGKNGIFNATYRKYGGAWIPVVVDMETRIRKSFPHCSGSYDAAQMASMRAKEMAGDDARLMSLKEEVAAGYVKIIGPRYKHDV